MLVAEMMVREPKCCGPDDPMNVAARIMWEHDCGAVAVVDGERRPIGVITDRDICMAAYTQGRPLAQLRVADSMAREVYTCQPDDSAGAAMRIMMDRQVHRLPVVDEHGVLAGMVALADVARALEPRNGERIGAEEIASLLAALRRKREPELFDANGSRLRRRGSTELRRGPRAVPVAGASGGQDAS